MPKRKVRKRTQRGGFKGKARKRTQRGGFLNRYDFPYAGGNTINTGLNTFKRIALVISQARKELKRFAPFILKRAIEQLHTTPFCLLGKFARNNKVNSILRKWNTIKKRTRKKKQVRKIKDRFG